jgi:hypothetical protein
MVATAAMARATATKPVLVNLRMRFIFIPLSILLLCCFFAGEIEDGATFRFS